MESPIRSLWPENDIVASKPTLNVPCRIWRSGNLLVMDKHARLPDVCLLTGRPAKHRVERELSYYPVGCHLFLLLGIVPYLIFVIQLASIVKIDFGLCERCYQRQAQRLWFGKILSCLGGFAILGAVALGLVTGAHELAVVLIFFGSIIGIAGMAIAFAGSCLVLAYKIDSDYVWLQGVDRDLLASLPEWQAK